MTAQTKIILDKLISDGEVQHIHGVFGRCKNYYVQFPNETENTCTTPTNQFQENYQIKFQTMYIRMQTCHQVATLTQHPK